MIKTLRLQHFRSYNDASFEFEDGVNIVVGPNASGKTNLLESILVLCRGESYRASDTDLVKHDESWSRLDADTAAGNRAIKLEITNNKAQKSYVINETNLKRLPYNRTIPVVLFEPNHLLLLTQSPDLRRGYLDEVLEQTIPAFTQLRRDYKRTLSQRNRLLKQNANPDDYFVWNVRLSELGGQIASARQQFVSSNTNELNTLYNRLVENEHTIEMSYKTSLPVDSYGSSMLRTLEQNLAKDQERGFTTVGPHRDDLALSIDGHELALAASRGETRTVLLALKLLEVQAIEKARNQKPILLLDDVFSELDGARRRNLTDYLQDHQTFITTTDADIVVQHFLDNCTVIAMG